MLLSQASFAGIIGVRSSGVSGTPSGKTSSSVVVNPGKSVDEKIIKGEGTAGVECKHDPASATYFPLDFFQNITKDGSLPTIEIRPDNKILVKMPASINTCGKFKPQIFQSDKDKNVTIMMQLEDGKTYSQYLACLEEKKILIDGKIDHDAIEGKNYSEYPYVLDYSFSKEKDIKKTLKVSFGYPVAFSDKVGKDVYPSTFGIDKDIELPTSLCMHAEKIQPEITYINKGQDVLLDEIRVKCMSGEAQKIAEAKRSLGNAEALKDIADKIMSELDASYLTAVMKDVKKINDDMAVIEERLLKEKDTIDESTAKKLAKKYTDLAIDLDRIFLNPAITRLEVLMKQVTDMDPEDPKRKAMDSEIKKLNEDIGAFAAKKLTTVGIDAALEKFAINDSAKTIEDIRLKSFWYGRVYAGPADKRGAPITFEQGVQKQSAGLQGFERVLSDRMDQYLVGKGNTLPLERTSKEKSAAVQKVITRWNKFQQSENDNLQKYCATGWTGQAKNPVQCQAFRAGAAGRLKAENSRIAKDTKYIEAKDRKLAKMNNGYAEYSRRQVASETQVSDLEASYGASITGYEDSYEERFPNYYGNQAFNPYDANNYNLGAGSGANMGNNVGYNPYVANPQMQVQPGQYQMQQNAGAWPRLQ
jgi:hypothetical protein